MPVFTDAEVNTYARELQESVDPETLNSILRVERAVEEKLAEAVEASKDAPQLDWFYLLDALAVSRESLIILTRAVV